MQFLTRFVSFDIPECVLLEQVDECEQLYIFLNSEKWTNFSEGEDFLDFADKFPMRKVTIDK